MVVPGLINLDFADVRTIMNNMGRAMMGTGEADGENRAVDCAQAAIANPLLDDYSLDGAKGLLINITGGTDLTLFEVDKVTNAIRAEVHPEADVIVGSIFDERMEGKIRVSVVATGLGPQISPGRRIVDLSVTNSMNNAVGINSNNGVPMPSSATMEAEEARVAEEARIAAEAIEMPSVIEDEHEEADLMIEPSEEIEVDSLVDEAPQLEVLDEDSADKDYTSIIDLISDTKDINEMESDVSENDAPDLFSTTSETLNKNESESIENRSEETDDDYLEIPAFLRRQSK